MQLSKMRANNVVDYFNSNGIDKKRLTSKWFGEQNQVNNCGQDCTEEQHKLNRRVELIPHFN